MEIENINIKEKFKERYEQLLKMRASDLLASLLASSQTTTSSLAADWNEFIKYSLTYLRKSIRINTLKISIDECKNHLKDWQLIQIPWCKEGFWIIHKKGRLDIGNTLEHQLGYIYVQEAASMIPPIVLDPKPNDKVLDMCASPGSKSSQIAALMKNKGILIANDIGLRINALSYNLQRCGTTNTIVTAMEGRFFKGFDFDKILLDAPCSGTGTIRKSIKTLEMWNPDMIKRLAGTQRQLIDTAFNNLKKNGILVYSTCTLEPEEDEGIIDFLLNKYENAELEEINVKGLKRSEAILEFEGKQYNKEIKKCLRIWPQDNDTEGFFVAKIKKI